jgi:hypothetical protein
MPVTARSLKPGRIDPPAPPPAKGFLWIKTNPPFAQVLVDGRFLGTTPMSVPIPIAGGPHRLDLEREGCLPSHTQFNIAPAETTFLKFTLERSPEEGS